MTPETPTPHQMLTPFLPQLKPGNEIILPHTTGVWSDNPARQLSALAEGTMVPPGVADVHSVPDPWARIILFDRALYDKDHVLHTQILGEWRGILALLGLRERMGFTSFSVKEVQLTHTGDPRLFSHILGRVQPGGHDVLQNGESWNRFYIIRALTADGSTRSFGMTSPSTLVATGASYPWALTEHEVPWFRQDSAAGRRLLSDPVPFLALAERKALAEWVLTVRQALGPMNSQRGGWMLGLLDEFANSLAPNSTAGLQEVTLDLTRGLGLHYTVAKVLDKAHSPETSTLSDLFLKTDQPGAPRYVVIDTEAGGKLSRDPKEIVVYRDITLATLKVRLPDTERLSDGILTSGETHPNADAASGARDETYVDETAPSGNTQSGAQQSPDGTTDAPTEADPVLHWCTPEFFFQKHLIYHRNLPASSASGKLFDPFPGCRPVRVEGAADPRRILLPLREDVLKLFTPSYLQQHFSVEWKGNASVVCRLRLEVKSILKPKGGKDEQTISTKPLVLEREYQGADLVPFDFIPALGVWPNFQLPSEPDGKRRWKRYFVFQSWRGTNKIEDFVIKPPTRAANGASNPSIAGGGTPGKPTALGASSVSKIVQNGDTHQIFALDSFPKYLVCQMTPQESAGGYRSNPTALLLLRAPETSNMRGNREAALGIDFGTTGTGVFWSWPNEKNPRPQEMRFKDRFFRVTGIGDEAQLARVARDVFIPATDWPSGKVLSVYQVFREPTPNEVLDGHVLFSKAEDPKNFIVGDERLVRSNLKWGTERENEAAKGFLTQVCMQSMSELVMLGANGLRLRYSYPTAFSFENKARFRGIWAGVIRRLRDFTDTPIVVEDERRVDNKEAVAATRFFANTMGRGFIVARGALTIDIGGGTTDIAFWNRDPDTEGPALMAHLSVLFAGRDIFLKPIERKPSVLTDLDPFVPIKSLLDRAAGSDSFSAQLDALIAAHGDRMLEELPARQDKVKGFLSIMGMGLCGIGFYSGLLAGGLAKIGKFTAGKEIPAFVGGNGSRLLKWCALNSFEPGMPIYDKFAACVLQGCQWGDPAIHSSVKISLSDRPKEEVAYGLVAEGLGNEGDVGNRLHIDENFKNPLAGEELHLRDGTASPWSTSPTLDMLRSSGIQVNPAMPVFRSFLKAAGIPVEEEDLPSIADHADGGLTVAVNENDLTYIADHINESLARVSERARNLRGPAEEIEEKALDPLRSEPVFILALKKLVEMKVDEWGKHA